MVKMRYLGPGHACSMKLRRAFVDLRDEADSCRPLGDEYKTIIALMRQIDETHQKLFGKPVADPAAHHITPQSKTPPA